MVLPWCLPSFSPFSKHWGVAFAAKSYVQPCSNSFLGICHLLKNFSTQEVQSGHVHLFSYFCLSNSNFSFFVSPLIPPYLGGMNEIVSMDASAISNSGRWHLLVSLQLLTIVKYFPNHVYLKSPVQIFLVTCCLRIGP